MLQLPYHTKGLAIDRNVEDSGPALVSVAPYTEDSRSVYSPAPYERLQTAVVTDKAGGV